MSGPGHGTHQNHPNELAHWLVAYVREAHPEVYREAMRARGAEMARRHARQQDEQAVTTLLRPGAQDDSLRTAYAEALREGEITTDTVVRDILAGGRWLVIRKYHDGERMAADVEAEDGTEARFWMEDLERAADQDWHGEKPRRA